MKVLPLAFALVLLAGCSSVRVDSDHDRSADFTAYRTWSWIPRSAMTVADEATYNQLTDQRIRTAIATELKGKGLDQAGGEGQLIVAYQVGVQEKTDVYDTGWGSRGYGYRRSTWHGGGIETRHWTEGTLIVDLLDRERKQLVWRGKAVGVVGDYEGQEQRINEAVAELFKLYPPEAGK